MTFSRSAALLLGAAAALGLAGCGDAPAPRSVPVRGSAPSAVSAGTPAQALGEPDVALAPNELLARVRTRLAERRRASAAILVRRYPDVAALALRTHDGAADDAVAFVARTHEAQCGSGDDWSRALAAHRVGDPLDAARTAARAALAAGHADEAVAVDLPRLARGASGPAAADGWRLDGIARLLLGDAAASAAAFEAAIGATALLDERAELGLLAAEAQRRAGALPAARAAWEQAIATAAELAAAPRAAGLPALWERAAGLRMDGVAWPAPAITALTGALDPALARRLEPTTPAGAEAVVWSAIGTWRLARGEHQAALLAYKRAETARADGAAVPLLRVQQGRCLLAMHQSQAATALLIPLVTSSLDPARRASLAVLGALAIKQGREQRGLGLLVNAVDGSVEPWPGQQRAVADLALARLIDGDDATGLELLHAAQRRFEEAGELEQLLLSLENERAYCELANRQEEAAGLARRIAALER